MAGALISASGYYLLSRLSLGSYALSVLPGLTVVALGTAAISAPLTTSILSSVSPTHRAAAAGFNSAISRIGSLMAVAASGAAMSGDVHAMLHGFRAAASVGAVLCLLAAALTGRLPARPGSASVSA